MTHHHPMNRRRLLQTLGASLPMITLPGFVTAAGQDPMPGNILILIELAGGNDGLNTVIPRTDDAYRSLRPRIGIAQEDMIGLDTDTGLHGGMRALGDLWEDGALQIVQGVGYPDPNRSHFRSIEIWNAGLGAQSQTQQGWVSTAFADEGPRFRDADGLVLGGDMGPLAGDGRFSAMRNEEDFVERQQNLPGAMHAVRPQAAVSPLDHVLDTYESARITGDAIYKRLSTSPATAFEFPGTLLGEQLRTAARLLVAGVEVPVLKVVQDGYDTHEDQPEQHADLLTDLSRSIGAFSAAMKQIGLWDQISIVTFSEFGRTARENGSGGTDHGTAAPLFVAGGNVRGGLSGQAPSLTNLVADDLSHTTDYRSVYAALLQDLWRIDAPAFPTSTPKLQLLNI
ncbi:DUF1501 domain-containing protein [Loktanella sp. Alg231-35]|uniref:DUF1501 domain-containing protein n=1 Tax=Loktanella sp. Alg231-35 TaxID=1922220 RepID=UPI000D562611|nr:DUF1501 domain-containing protein [Loktanella sp. Alg231-35]